MICCTTGCLSAAVWRAAARIRPAARLGAARSVVWCAAACAAARERRAFCTTSGEQNCASAGSYLQNPGHQLPPLSALACAQVFAALARAPPAARPIAEVSDAVVVLQAPAWQPPLPSEAPKPPEAPKQQVMSEYERFMAEVRP